MRRHTLAAVGLFGCLWTGLGAQEDSLVGVTWTSSELISFDPHAGTTLAKHLQLNSHEAFRGLAFDEPHRRLYALTQSTHNLYRIDVDTMEVTHVGNLRIDMREQQALDTGPLAYDPFGGALYTIVEHWDGDGTHLWSELCKVDVQDGSLNLVNRFDGPLIDSLAFNRTDRHLYGLAIYGSGPWDSSFKADLVRIDPATGSLETLFQTPYHTMLGLALLEPFTSFSWVNWTTHLYAETDLLTGTIKEWGDADASNVVSAMTHGEFALGSKPLAEDPAFFSYTGRVTSVWDPDNHLGGRIRPGYRFSGKLSYDAAAPYKDPDPNLSPPYGMTVEVNGVEFCAPGLSASVVNNYYNGWDQSVSDKLEFDASDQGHASLSWSLKDPSARTLRSNNALPDRYNLSKWRQNFFVITGQSGSDPKRASYYVIGKVNRITRTRGALDFDANECRASF